jgi:hypothetical protein
MLLLNAVASDRKSLASEKCIQEHDIVFAECSCK